MRDVLSGLMVSMWGWTALTVIYAIRRTGREICLWTFLTQISKNSPILYRWGMNCLKVLNNPRTLVLWS